MCAFSATLTTTALNRSSLRWFKTSPCRAVPEGHTSITSTAPHPKNPGLLHHGLPQRSCRTVVCVADDPPVTDPLARAALASPLSGLLTALRPGGHDRLVQGGQGD